MLCVPRPQAVGTYNDDMLSQIIDALSQTRGDAGVWMGWNRLVANMLKGSLPACHQNTQSKRGVIVSARLCRFEGIKYIRVNVCVRMCRSKRSRG